MMSDESKSRTAGTLLRSLRRRNDVLPLAAGLTVVAAAMVLKVGTLFLLLDNLSYGLSSTL